MERRFDSGPRRVRNALVAVCLIGILGLALGLRLCGLERQSLHYDELWNVELATGRGSLHMRLPRQALLQDVPNPTSLSGAPAVWNIWTHMDRVTHPPLYSMLLRLWCDLLGTRDRATRALAAVFSTLAILLLFDAVRTLHGDLPALWAAGIMALSGAQIELAQEVRPYALLLLLGCGALAVMARIERDGGKGAGGRWRMLALGAAALLMLLTQYFSFVAIGALGVFALIRLRGRTRRDAIGALFIAGVIFAAIWGPFLWAQRASFAETGDNWLRVSEPHHAVQTLRRLALVPMRLLFEPPQRSQAAAYVASVLLVAPVVLLVTRKRPELLLWTLWMWATVGLIAVLELVRSTHHLDEMRYTLLAGPGLYALLPVLVAAPSGWLLRNALPAVAVLGCALSLSAAYSTYKDDFRGVAEFVDAQHATGEPVVFSVAGSGEQFGGGLFLGVSHYAGSYPWPVMILTAPPTQTERQSLRAAPGAWIISHGPLSAEQLFPGDPVISRANFPPLAIAEHVRTAREVDAPSTSNRSR